MPSCCMRQCHQTKKTEFDAVWSWGPRTHSFFIHIQQVFIEYPPKFQALMRTGDFTLDQTLETFLLLHHAWGTQSTYKI